MQTLSLTLALLLAMLLVQPGGPTVAADRHDAAAGLCQCEHHDGHECDQDHCTALCAAACAGGCAPVPFLPAGAIPLPAAAVEDPVQPQAECYSDITLPVPHPPPNA